MGVDRLGGTRGEQHTRLVEAPSRGGDPTGDRAQGSRNRGLRARRRPPHRRGRSRGIDLGRATVVPWRRPPAAGRHGPAHRGSTAGERTRAVDAIDGADADRTNASGTAGRMPTAPATAQPGGALAPVAPVDSRSRGGPSRSPAACGSVTRRARPVGEGFVDLAAVGQ